jgi:hypothetical protein
MFKNNSHLLRTAISDHRVQVGLRYPCRSALWLVPEVDPWKIILDRLQITDNINLFINLKHALLFVAAQQLEPRNGRN